MSMSGDDAYVLAMDYVDETLKGGGALKGDDGKSAYQSWLDLGNTGTEEDFINSLKGEKGQVGEKGDDGKSAYQYAQDGGYTGTETEFTTNIARSGVISKELEVERARIDNLTTLKDGSTTGDAELIDARIDKDGNTYVNVGEHIRTVSSQISSEIGDLKKEYKRIHATDFEFNQWLSGAGTVGDSECYKRTDFISVKQGDKFEYSLYGGTDVAYIVLFREKEYVQSNVIDFRISLTDYNTVEEGSYTVPQDGYIVFSGRVESGDNWYAKRNNVNTLCKHITIERGALSTDYHYSFTEHDYNNYVRTAYRVSVGNAKYMWIDDSNYPLSHVYITFYNSNNEKIISLNYNWLSLEIPTNAHYFELESYIGESFNSFDSLKVYFNGGTECGTELKRVAYNSVSEKLTFRVSDNICTTARLILPPNYEARGNKVPLILWLDGSGNFIHWDGDFASNKLPYLRYLRDEGFAILSVFAWGNNYYNKYPACGMAYPFPLITNLECIKKGVEYACDRYNIDSNNIHIMSKSQGGLCALYYATHNELNVKSIGMFAPVLDWLSMRGESAYLDTRKAIHDEISFVGDIEYFKSTDYSAYSERGVNFLRSNLPQLCTMNSAWTGLIGGTLEEKFVSSTSDCKTFWTDQVWNDETRNDIYTNKSYTKIASVPVKIWGSSDDNQTPYLKMVEVVEQLKNGGTEAWLRTLERGTGGHSCADVDGNFVNSVTTKLGIKHTNIPIGWIENVEWIRSKMPK